MEQPTFRITTMTKYELARAYSISASVFRAWMKTVIKRNPELFTLKQVNHKKHKRKAVKQKKQQHRNHLLTPKQVQAFVNHYGIP